MISDFFTAVFYQPLYNGLIFLFDIFPFFDAGVIIILFTVLIKLLLFPLSKKAVVTQMKIKQIEPNLKKIKEKHKDDKQEQARQIMDFYRKEGINPFSSFFLILLQIPIIISLYYIFLQSDLPSVDTDLLYSFVSSPEEIKLSFLGWINVTEKSVILALLAGVSSFFQLRYSMPKMAGKKKENPTFKDDLARSMNFQMRYFFPLMVLFIAYTFSGTIALYLFASNIFTLLQELYVRTYIKGKPEQAAQEQTESTKKAERNGETTLKA